MLASAREPPEVTAAAAQPSLARPIRCDASPVRGIEPDEAFGDDERMHRHVRRSETSIAATRTIHDGCSRRAAHEPLGKERRRVR